MTTSSEVKLLGADLGPGETLRDVCPVCGGGSSNEKSFAITRDEDNSLVWVCHRASCDAKGSTKATFVSGPVAPKPKPKKRFRGTTNALSDYHREIISGLWGVQEPEHWYWTPEYGGRLAMSVRSPKYTHRGWVLRDIRGRSAVKALTYIDEGEEGLSWYREFPDRGTLLVEDIPSAVRASKYVNSVALLGTGIGLTRGAEIADHATRPIILALDQDATALSFRWARRYAALWGDVEILMLQKDIKNMKEADVEKLLAKYNA